MENLQLRLEEPSDYTAVEQLTREAFDPDYYSRYGFVPAETYSIGKADNMYVVPLQAYELYSGA